MTNHYNDNTDVWDINIAPKSSLLQFNLGEIWNYKDLIMLMVKRDFAAKYKQTILGPLWHFIQPLLTTIISYLIFFKIANIGTDGKNPLLFQMAGIIIWSYFSSCLTSTANTFKDNASVFGKVYFPRLVMPISVIISNLVQLGIQCLLLTIAIIFLSFNQQNIFSFGVNWLLLPVVIFIMAGIGLGAGIIISSLTTKYRDFQVLITFGIQLLMYGSAVNYPLEVLQNKGSSTNILFAFVKWNPISTLVETFRNIILGGTINYRMLGYTAIFMFFSLFFGIMMFNKVEKSFMDTV